MIAKSTAIVRGRVTGTYAALRGSIIYTHYEVQVSERWKGPEAAQIDIVVPGGATAGLRQTFPGAPVLNSGSEYILFLWTGASGLTNIIGLSQGVFDLTREPKEAGLFAARAATSETMLDSLGNTVKDEPVRMKLDALRERVATTLARGVAR